MKSSIQVEGFSTICSYCGKLLKRSATGEKVPLFNTKHHYTADSHGICPDCLQENFPQEYAAILEEKITKSRNIC